MEWLLVPITLAVIWVVVPFVLGPVVVRRRSWKARQPTVEPMPPAALPADVAAYLGPHVERVRALGFDPVGYARLADLVPGAVTHFALLVHRASGDQAMAAVIGSKVKQVRYVEFSAKLAGEREVDTNNSPEVGCEAPDPKRHVFAFPGLGDVGQLYRLHRRLLEQASPGERPWLPPAGRELEELAQGLAREADRQARHGYWSLDRRHGKYHPTWKGAVLMAWKLAWPVGPLRRWRRRRRAAALLRTFGLAP